MRIHILYLLMIGLLPLMQVQAQNPYAMLKEVRSGFKRINDLKCNADMQFEIPGVKLNRISGSLYYKKPGKFRVNAKGLIFVPKQSPFMQLETLTDTTTYVAVFTGPETVNGKICNGITIIPNNNTDLMVMKLSIGQSDNRIYKAQLTLKREGTVTYYNTYAAATGIIPSSIMFEADFRKFKMPKALSGDIGGATEKPTKQAANNGFETGRIRMTLTNVELNRKLDDAIFKEAETMQDL
jgi:hypothetical protein